MNIKESTTIKSKNQKKHNTKQNQELPLLIKTDKGSHSPVKSLININNSLVLPKISPHIEIKKKEPTLRYVNVAYENHRKSMICTKSKIRTAFNNNEEEETLKKS